MKFRDPSVQEVVEHHILSNPSDFRDLCAAAVFFDQPMHLWKMTTKVDDGSIPLPLRYSETFITSLERTWPLENSSEDKFIVFLGHKVSYRLDLDRKSSLTIDVVEALKGTAATRLLPLMLSCLSSGLSNYPARKANLVMLLERSRNLLNAPKGFHQDLFTVIKPAILSEFYSPDDFEAYKRFEDYN